MDKMETNNEHFDKENSSDLKNSKEYIELSSSSNSVIPQDCNASSTVISQDCNPSSNETSQDCNASNTVISQDCNPSSSEISQDCNSFSSVSSQNCNAFSTVVSQDVNLSNSVISQDCNSSSGMSSQDCSASSTVNSQDCKLSSNVISQDCIASSSAILEDPFVSVKECNTKQDHSEKIKSNYDKDDANRSVNVSGSLKNNSLFALSIYGESSSSDSDDDDNSEKCIKKGEQEIRFQKSKSRFDDGHDETSNAFRIRQIDCIRLDDDEISISSSSSSSCVEENYIFSNESDYSDDDDDFDIELALKPKKKPTGIKTTTKGELTLDDLPPIQDLSISVPQDQCILLGTIINTVDKLVTVQGIQNMPPLDLDTVLFLEWNKPLGNVFDVFGPVGEPLYCVRFNSSDHIKEKNVTIGMPVYFVPESNHTKYVFLSHLMQIKGSDASWEDNNEPPPQYLEYSDDEEERKAKKALKKELRNDIKKDPDAPKKKRRNARKDKMNQQNCKTEQRKHQSHLRNNNRRNQNNVIRSPGFVPPPSTYSSSCASPASTKETHFSLNKAQVRPQFSTNHFKQNNYISSPNAHLRNPFSNQPPNYNFGVPPTLPLHPIMTSSTINTPLSINPFDLNKHGVSSTAQTCSSSDSSQPPGNYNFVMSSLPPNQPTSNTQLSINPFHLNKHTPSSTFQNCPNSFSSSATSNFAMPVSSVISNTPLTVNPFDLGSSVLQNRSNSISSQQQTITSAPMATIGNMSVPPPSIVPPANMLFNTSQNQFSSPIRFQPDVNTPPPVVCTHTLPNAPILSDVPSSYQCNSNVNLMRPLHMLPNAHTNMTTSSSPTPPQFPPPHLRSYNNVSPHLSFPFPPPVTPGRMQIINSVASSNNETHINHSSSASARGSLNNNNNNNNNNSFRRFKNMSQNNKFY